MDAAIAAAMSDPIRNANFRRRWDETPLSAPNARSANAPEPLGAIGLALLDAWRQKAQRRMVAP